MKKVFLIITMFCVCFSLFSQETEKVKTEAKNEIKLNLLMTLLSFPDISYERIWGNNIGVGLSAGFPLENFDTNFRLIPYCRFYFGESPVKSFFIEANVGIQGYKKYTYTPEYYGYGGSYEYYGHNSQAENSTNVGLGVAFGYKYINSYGLIGELFLGIGRTFDDYGAYPRVGISIGKQF